MTYIMLVQVQTMNASFYINTLYSQKLLIVITSKTLSDMFIIIHKHKLFSCVFYKTICFKLIQNFKLFTF